jgi:hypothetical protein
MSALVHQVSNFVQACEALHWGLLEGHSLSIEERDIIQTAAELLMRVEDNTDAPGWPRTRPSPKVWKRWDEQLDYERHP